eukprot:563377-Pelagomonas_calceolata.AAC.3
MHDNIYVYVRTGADTLAHVHAHAHTLAHTQHAHTHTHTYAHNLLPQANPSISEKLYEQFKKKKNSLNKVTKEDILNKYGSCAEHAEDFLQHRVVYAFRAGALKYLICKTMTPLH